MVNVHLERSFPLHFFFRKHVYDYEQIVVTPIVSEVNVRSAQLNEENEDFASRRRYHQSAYVQGHMVNMDD